MSVLEPDKRIRDCTGAPSETVRLRAGGHGRNGQPPLQERRKYRVKHAQLNPGDPCPECREGKVYRQKEPKTLVRIVGRPPLEATVFEMERLRCNACGEVFTAEEPRRRRGRKSTTPLPWR